MRAEADHFSSCTSILEKSATPVAVSGYETTRELRATAEMGNANGIAGIASATDLLIFFYSSFRSPPSDIEEAFCTWSNRSGSENPNWGFS